MRTYTFLLILFLAGCAQAPIDPATSQNVINSVTDPSPRPDWRLSVDGFASETGGAALRQPSIEHVVTRKPPAQTSEATNNNGLVTRSLSEAEPSGTQPSCQTDSADIERAWRKYCRHKLDMTDCDREIVRTTQMPPRLKASCDPKSLKK